MQDICYILTNRLCALPARIGMATQVPTSKVVIILAVEQQQCLTTVCLTSDVPAPEYRGQVLSLCACAAEQSFLDDGQVGEGYALICVRFCSSHRVYRHISFSSVFHCHAASVSFMGSKRPDMPQILLLWLYPWH